MTQLVRALPGYGQAKADALLHEVGIDEGRRVGGLGSQQRNALLNAVGRD